MTEPAPSSRRMMLLLTALFVLPLIVAAALYYGHWRPPGNTNHGELLPPFRQLPEFTSSLRGKWALAYVGDGTCNEDCKQALVFARQTRLSLAQDTARVSWALLATEQCCDRGYLDAEHRGMQILDVSGKRAELLSVLPNTDLAHSLFVIDPLGNIVLRYDVRQSPRGLLDDMKKLLKLSHIG